MSSDLTSYVSAALTRACLTIEAAPDGQRNTIIFDESRGIGQLVGAHALAYQTASDALVNAGIAVCGKAEQSNVEASVKSGLETGIKKPRDLDKITDKKFAPRKPTAAEKNAELAAKIYGGGVRIEGTLAEKYLREKRGIRGELPKNLRINAVVRSSDTCSDWPALIAPVMQPGQPGSPKCVHITYLDPNTGSKAPVATQKRILGPVNGGGIWLGKYAARMCAAEGIEKGLAIQNATGIPAVAGLSSSSLPNLVLPQGVQEMIICADGDFAGEASLHRAFLNWKQRNIKIFICYPPVAGKDWDECPAEDVLKTIQDAKEYTPPSNIEEKLKSNLSLGSGATFETNGNNEVKKNEFNMLLAIEMCGISLSYDEFSMECIVEGLKGYGPILDDATIDELYLTLEREFSLVPKYENFRRSIKSACRRNRFHPVRDYLSKVQKEWDGHPRIDSWLAAYAGAPETPLVSAISAIMLMAAVRRVRCPGAKFDEMVVLEGSQGKNKSTALAVLAGEQWFSDRTPLNVPPRDVIERLRGRWILECGELAAMRRTGVEDLKVFLSGQTDVSTMKYERETTQYNRQCIFIGTTNEAHYLTDPTGNRRFWPVPVTVFDIAALTRDRNQLWGEAATREAAGESIRLPQELWEAAAAEQAEREERDEWDGIISEWLEAELRDNRRNPHEPYRITIAAIGRNSPLAITPDKLTSMIEKRIARSLRRCGWKMTHQSNGKRWWQKPALEAYRF